MKNFQLLKCLLWVLLIALSSSCKSDKDGRAFSPDNIESEIFKVKAGKYTTFTTKQGVVIEVPAQTFFRREPNGIVTLEVKTALNTEDMILGGLSTVDSSGRLLESGGMVYINAKPKQPINPDFPIRVKIPAKNINPAMQMFRLRDETNPAAGWIKPAPLANDEAIATYAKGWSNFTTHCASCHNTNFRQPLTGPPLGNVHLNRSAQWLRNYTRSSQKMIAGGDRIAVCLWDFWKPVIMPDFPKLSDEDIDAIYTYIANESAAQGIASDEIQYQTGCVAILSTDHSESSDSTAQPATDSVIVPVKFYEVEFRDFGWVNVDFFPEDMVEVGPVEISVEKPELAGWVEIIVVFQQRKIVVMTEQDGKIYRLMNSKGKPKVRLPLDELVEIYGSGKSADGKFWYCRTYAKISETNQYTLEFREVTADELYRFMKMPARLQYQ